MRAILLASMLLAACTSQGLVLTAWDAGTEPDLEASEDQAGPSDLGGADLSTPADFTLAASEDQAGPSDLDLGGADLSTPADFTVPPDLTPGASLSGSTITPVPGSAIADGQDEIVVTIRIVDESGAPLAGRTVALHATGSGNTIDQPTVTDGDGTAVARLRSTKAEEKQLSVSLGGTGATLEAHPSVTFVPGPAASLRFDVQPSGAPVHISLAPAVRVSAVDAYGNLALVDGTVTMSLAAAPAGGTLSGQLSAPLLGGIASFDQLMIDRAGAGYRLAASSGALSGTSAAFEILTAWYPVNHGLTGARIEGIALSAVSPGNWIVATDGGLFRTRDKGASWRSLGPAGVTFSVAQLPTVPETIVVSAAAGITRSSDDGLTWQLVLPNVGSRVMSYDAKQPNTVFAAQGNKLWRSMDAGQTFSLVATPNVTDIRAVSVDPYGPEIYLSGVGGLFVSGDGGASWSLSMAPALTGYPFIDVVFAPDGRRYTCHAGAVYRYANGAWQKLAASAAWLSNVAIDSGAPERVYALDENFPLRVSEDQGETWTSLGNALAAGEVLKVDPTDHSTLVVTSVVSTVTRSDDRGATFTLARAGIESALIDQLAIDSQNRMHLVAGGESGCFESFDGADSFHPCALPGMPEGQASMLALEADPTRSRFFVGGAGGGAQGLYRWNAGSWTQINQYWNNARAFGVDATDPNILWSLGDYRLRSNDGGATFTYKGPIDLSTYPIWRTHPTDPNVIYLVSGENLLRSSDRGASFQQLYWFASPDRVFALEIDATNPARIYVAADYAVWRSLDGGTTFSTVLDEWPFQYTSLAVHPTTGRVLVGSASGILRSDDHGDTFAPASDGLSWMNSRRLVFDPVDPEIAYVGTTWRGVWKTRTGGR